VDLLVLWLAGAASVLASPTAGSLLDDSERDGFSDKRRDTAERGGVESPFRRPGWRLAPTLSAATS
jgi:hypothetical protein